MQGESFRFKSASHEPLYIFLRLEKQANAYLQDGTLAAMQRGFKAHETPRSYSCHTLFPLQSPPDPMTLCFNGLNSHLFIVSLKERETGRGSLG